MTRWVRSMLLLAVLLMAVSGAPSSNAISDLKGSGTAGRSIAVGDTTPDAVVAPQTQGRAHVAAVRVVPLGALALSASAAVLRLYRPGVPGGVGRRFEDVGDRWRALLIGAPPSFL